MKHSNCVIIYIPFVILSPPGRPLQKWAHFPMSSFFLRSPKRSHCQPGNEGRLFSLLDISNFNALIKVKLFQFIFNFIKIWQFKNYSLFWVNLSIIWHNVRVMIEFGVWFKYDKFISKWNPFILKKRYIMVVWSWVHFSLYVGRFRFLFFFKISKIKRLVHEENFMSIHLELASLSLSDKID